jgi:hypothetical protein
VFRQQFPDPALDEIDRRLGVGNSMRSRTEGGSTEATTAVFVPPISTPMSNREGMGKKPSAIS